MVEISTLAEISTKSPKLKVSEKAKNRLKSMSKNDVFQGVSRKASRRVPVAKMEPRIIKNPSKLESPEESQRCLRNRVFSCNAKEKKFKNLRFPQKWLKGRNLEKVLPVLVFTVYSAMSHLGEPKKFESTACTAWLRKRTGNASARTVIIVKKFENSWRN